MRISEGEGGAEATTRFLQWRWPWPLIVAAIFAQLAITTTCARSLPADAPQPNQWKMIYEVGVAPISPQTGILLTVGDENLVLQPKKGKSFSISAATIVAVSSNLVSSRTASKEQAALWVGAVQFSPYTLMLLPFGLAGMAATYPVKSHYAYVNILWEQNGAEQEILLRLNRSDYTAFVTKLRKTTGKEWKDLDTEWDNIQQELKREGTNKVSVSMDREVRIGKSKLKAGAYQLVLLEREGKGGEVYFFPGNQVGIEHLAAVASVQIAAPDSESEAGPVSYRVDQDGETTISSVRVASRILRFP